MDQEAFAELYRQYAPRIGRLCLYRLSNVHEAQDATQETFARAWQAMPRFQTGRPFYPWLSTIATNLCKDMLDKRAHSVPVPEFFGAACVEEAHERVVDMEDGRAAARAMGGLCGRHRRILLLRESLGLSYEAIAEHEALSVSAVESLLWRARGALRRGFVRAGGVL